jgi:hypothetical protein
LLIAELLYTGIAFAICYGLADSGRTRGAGSRSAHGEIEGIFIFT